MAMNRADKSPKPLKNQTPQAEYDKKATELEEELKELPEDKLPLIRQCIEEGNIYSFLGQVDRS